ncbi:MAG TPA: RNA polymerase sporulation sigma factor SigK [Pseudogracilibacillus sp.]|nr:RNA polymerase sporulation sigma factor SigK [Pseudogracilibacillus sp.]
MSLFLTVLTKLIKDTLLFVSYVKNNAFPQPLSEEEERYYIEQMGQGSHEARNKLIEHNLRLVAHIVKKFNHQNHLAEDLISIGTIGLIKGVESYKPGRGTKLATYAARCIENEILMFLRTLRKQRKDISLHSPIGQDHEGNEISLFDVIEADNEDIMEYVQLNMQLIKLKKHFAVLDDREQTVLIYRYGLNNEKELTQKEIASMLGISRSYVSRIEKRALLKVFRAYYEEENKRK